MTGEFKKTYGKKTLSNNEKKEAPAATGPGQGTKAPCALSVIEDGAEQFTRITGLWLKKNESTGRMYLSGTNKETGMTYVVNIFDNEVFNG